MKTLRKPWTRKEEEQLRELILRDCPEAQSEAEASIEKSY
jgi:hypothetical protein